MWREFLLDIWQYVQMSEEDKYLDFLSFYLTLATTLCGVGISIFTLTSAFIVSKKDLLKQLKDEINKDRISLSYAYKIQSLQIFIKRMKEVTTSSIWLISFSLISIITICILKLCQPNNWGHIVLLCIISAFVFLFVCLYKLYSWYRKY